MDFNDIAERNEGCVEDFGEAEPDRAARVRGRAYCNRG
jgi:hypothetical protein